VSTKVAQRRRPFESLLSELSSRFGNLPGNEVEREIETALRELIAFFGFDRSSFAEFDAAGRPTVICSVAVKGVEPFPLGPVPSFLLGWYLSEAQTGKIIALRMAADLPPQAKDLAAYFRVSGLRSHLGIPIRIGGRIVAGIGFASFTKKRTWVDSLIKRLKLLGEVFALALARKRAEESLSAAIAEIQQLKKDRPPVPSKEVLCSSFGLTAAEADLALAIARGEDLASIAATRGITIGTARTHLKAVFSKLGAHRQAHLVVLLSRNTF
jgi:DNA-binding CsgD family transcriptional regulator